MTVIAQDDHLTAGACAACVSISEGGSKNSATKLILFKKKLFGARGTLGMTMNKTVLPYHVIQFKRKGNQSRPMVNTWIK